MASDPSKIQLKVKFEAIEGEELSRLTESFPNFKYGIYRGNPGGFFLSPGYKDHAEEILNLEVKDDDIWVVTFPKCGTTWTQDLVWLVANDCDFETAAKQSINQRFPFLEMALLLPNNQHSKPDSENAEMGHLMIPLNKLSSLPSPRFIKSHLPFYLLPPSLLEKSKVVYVARNPKDVIVSFYYHHRLFNLINLDVPLEKFAEHLINDEVYFSPFFAHILEAWNQRNHPNLLFLFYEDMKADLAGQILKVAKFLGKDLSEDDLRQLTDHLRIDNFAKNPSVNMEGMRNSGMLNSNEKFIRKGKTGDWKNHFSPELNARIDAWIEKNLENTDLKFVTQLEKQD